MGVPCRNGREDACKSALSICEVLENLQPVLVVDYTCVSDGTCREEAGGALDMPSSRYNLRANDTPHGAALLCAYSVSSIFSTCF